MNVTFDLKSLASALAKMNKLPKEIRPVSYQDYLQSLSKFAGFASYEAFMAAGGRPASPESVAAALVDAEYTSVWTSGHTITTPCKLNLETMEVTDVGVADPSDDVEGLFEEHVSYNGTTYYVVHEPDDMAVDVTDRRTFAFHCAEDFEKAVQKQLDAIESARIFQINGIVCQYKLDGDWFDELSSCFDRLDPADDLRDRLQSLIVWQPEGVDQESLDRYEYSFSAYEILFATLKVTPEGTCLLIPDGDNVFEVRLLS